MGETLAPFSTGFNKSLRVEIRAERLTGSGRRMTLSLSAAASRSGRQSGPGSHPCTGPEQCAAPNTIQLDGRSVAGPDSADSNANDRRPEHGIQQTRPL
jgi:hypothetical protein